MHFEWDNRKNQINIQKHGIDFADVTEMFDGPLLSAIDDRENYSEERWIGIGSIKSRIVVVIYVEIELDTIRIISVRKALSHERKQYEQYIKDQLG